MKLKDNPKLMKLDWLASTVLILGVTFLTMLFWKKVFIKEGFNNPILDQILEVARQQEEQVITPTQAANNYRALLVFIKSNFSDGLKLVYDLNKRVYGRAERVPETFDPRQILDDYKNPIAGI